jgi:hypothetical protein
MADRLVVIDKGVVALDVAASALSLSDFQQKYKFLVTKQ